jgi:soluble lytic murein transglycosylase
MSNSHKPAFGSAVLLALGLGTAGMPLATELRIMAKDATASQQAWVRTQKQILSFRYNSFRKMQAKELMGLGYTKSVVQKGEQVADVNSFVFEKVRQAMGKDSPVADLVAGTIIEESKHHRFDPIFLMSVISNESSFNTLARGGHGEIGLMQLKPSTAQWIAKKIGLKWEGSHNLVNPSTNIKLGAAYLAKLRKKFDRRGSYYLSAYNMGTTKFNRALRAEKKPSIYADRVLQRYQNFYIELLSRKASTTTLASIEAVYEVAANPSESLAKQ